MQRLGSTVLVAAALLALAAGGAHAADEAGHDGHGYRHNSRPQATESLGRTGGEVFVAKLKPLKVNRSTAAGDARIMLKDNRAHVWMRVSGVLADAPHAQHVRFAGEGRCPVGSEAGIHQGFPALSLSEGRRAHGGIGVSLTTSGDTGPDSVLAMDRFPSAPDGSYDYARTITLSGGAIDAIRDGSAVIVVHGIDYNGNGRYDDVLGGSDVASDLSMEATSPTACGVLR
ncbi:hypothetical protein [Nocardiopsis ansamitocini]|uniref:Uncharacterized protein n=1 Tax=Nocardiopsis ansamitocini TaxID=1670832 RepID=A0A9W6PA91_9ACTN|nr:hypothetical protein [Nocardiopsis ansamitocini]GLU49836.1 hypothetical protein Nans01_41870 [Nocardiopsis ansamitocini]